MGNPTLAMVFPGQGSQKIGMLADAGEAFPVVRETFAEASSVLGYDMWHLIQQGEQEDINLTETTQPVLLTASVALWRAWQQKGGATPGLMAGHSLGEFSALVCAGSLAFTDAVALVQKRGAYMQSAVPVGEGAMAAVIGLDDETVETACEEAAQDECVSAANYNAPGQVAIAGHVGAVERAIALCREKGAKRAMPLPVSAPFHTALMQPAGEQLEEAMRAIELAPPEVPVVHNVHAQPESDPQRIRELLVQQISRPVQWVGCVRYMVGQGITETVECGAGKVLSGLNKRIHKPLKCHTIEDVAGLEAALEEQA